jgi:hypothetical protein
MTNSCSHKSSITYTNKQLQQISVINAIPLAALFIQIGCLTNKVTDIVTLADLNVQIG